MLVLFQKIGISFLFPKVSRHESFLHKSLAKVRAFLNDFIEFQSSYWVADVTRRAQGKLIYNSYRESLDVNEVFENLRLGIDDLQEHY